MAKDQLQTCKDSTMRDYFEKNYPTGVTVAIGGLLACNIGSIRLERTDSMGLLDYYKGRFKPSQNLKLEKSESGEPESEEAGPRYH